MLAAVMPVSCANSTSALPVPHLKPGPLTDKVPPSNWLHEAVIFYRVKEAEGGPSFTL